MAADEAPAEIDWADCTGPACTVALTDLCCLAVEE